MMCDCGTHTAAGGGAFGDFTIGDVFESVVYWLPADRNTLDALSHACTTTRHHLCAQPRFLLMLCSYAVNDATCAATHHGSGWLFSASDLRRCGVCGIASTVCRGSAVERQCNRGR